VTQDTFLKRITVANDDGDVYVESVGEFSEIVLKTQKVRVDGDVYCHGGNVGISKRVDDVTTANDGLKSRIDALNATDAELKGVDDGLKSRIDGLDTKTTTLTPPKCMPPGGDKLRFDGTNWLCVCAENWSGPTCETPPSPPPSPSPPPPYVTPPPAPPNPPPSPPPNPLSPNERLRLAVTECLQQSSVGDCTCDNDLPCGYVTDGRSISAFDTSDVTDMRELFKDASSFNRDISGWDTSQVTSMDSMFLRAYGFNKPLVSWNTSAVTSMSSMFNQAIHFNQNLNSWNVQSVTNFREMFAHTQQFNGDITSWDVRRATSMGYMFWNSAFRRDIRAWNVGPNVEVSGMFLSAQFLKIFKCPGSDESAGYYAPSACYLKPLSTSYALARAVDACFVESFDGDCQCDDGCGEAVLPISKWNTTGIVYMHDLFYNRTYFNQPLKDWDTSRVIRMENMFRNSSAFNQNLSSWSVDLVQDAANMFNGASMFSGDVSTWNLPSGTPTTDMFKDADAYNERFSCGDADDGPPKSCVVAASCDASTAPANGNVGDCTSNLKAGERCQPVCDDGYAVSGPSYCAAGTLLMATCVSIPAVELGTWELVGNTSSLDSNWTYDTYTMHSNGTYVGHGSGTWVAGNPYTNYSYYGAVTGYSCETNAAGQVVVRSAFWIRESYDVGPYPYPAWGTKPGKRSLRCVYRTYDSDTNIDVIELGFYGVHDSEEAFLPGACPSAASSDISWMWGGVQSYRYVLRCVSGCRPRTCAAAA